MDTKDDELIEKLILELKKHDSIKAGEYDNLPEIPEEFIEELIKMGTEALEPLLDLLKDPSRVSCYYSLVALTEIGDPRSVEPILDVLFGDEYHGNFRRLSEHDQPILALHKIGLPALEPTLEYLRDIDPEEEYGFLRIMDGLEVLGGIKHEKSYSMLVEMLFYPYEEVQEFAIEILGRYGDKRAIEDLEKLLVDEEFRDLALDSIRSLASFYEYQKIVDPFAPVYIKEASNEINQNLRQLQFTHEYPKEFDGDDAELFSSLARQIKILGNTRSIIDTSLRLAWFEKVITFEEYWETRKITNEILVQENELKKRNEEEITIIEGYIPGPVLIKETRSYRGLTSVSRYVEHPKLEKLRLKIQEWLKKQYFRVLKEKNSYYARKGDPENRKGIYVASAKDYDNKRRIWGQVSYMIWGGGWEENEAEQFKTSFITFLDKSVEQLVGDKKFEVKIIEE
jgi:hypothetical protein